MLMPYNGKYKKFLISKIYLKISSKDWTQTKKLIFNMLDD